MIDSGDRFGDYTVVRLLGRGGMGSVYLLANAEGAEVAAKELESEGKRLQQLKKQAGIDF